MNNSPLHRGAVHEAGHVVMARVLGVKLGPIRIDVADPSAAASASVLWTEETRTLENELRVAAASRACLHEFGFSTLNDCGLRRDHECMIEILLDMFASDDEIGREQYRDRLETGVGHLFAQCNVRAAVKALVATLTRKGKIEGPEAEEIIDQHVSGAVSDARDRLRPP